MSELAFPILNIVILGGVMLAAMFELRAARSN